jgi:hypothetical protein
MPRPPQLPVQPWTSVVFAVAGGRVPHRPVRILYQHPCPQPPRRQFGDGIVRTLWTLTAGSAQFVGTIVVAVSMYEPTLNGASSVRD